MRAVSVSRSESTRKSAKALTRLADCPAGQSGQGNPCFWPDQFATFVQIARGDADKLRCPGATRFQNEGERWVTKACVRSPCWGGLVPRVSSRWVRPPRTRRHRQPRLPKSNPRK